MFGLVRRIGREVREPMQRKESDRKKSETAAVGGWLVGQLVAFINWPIRRMTRGTKNECE